MMRLDWTETLEGWKSGGYQIELAAPHLWVLSRIEGSRFVVLETSGSLTSLKTMAAGIEMAKLRRSSVARHLIVLVLAAVAAFLAPRFSAMLIVPTVALAFLVGLRLLTVWVDAATGSPWDRISDSYQ
jgi:hypothetical protein